MFTPFDGLLATAERSITAMYAEPFDFLPMVDKINGKPVPDQDRTIVSAVMGIFDDRGVILEAHSSSQSSRSSSQPTLSVRTDCLPDGIRRLDRFKRAGNGKAYEVKHVASDDLGRTLITLTEL